MRIGVKGSTHCYKLYPGVQEDFVNAEQFCRESAFGGQLVVINSKEVNDAIAEKLMKMKVRDPDSCH